MKAKVVLLVCVMLLVGCAKTENHMDTALSLRQQMNEKSGCTFEVEITVDYESTTQSFSLSCQSDGRGEVTFEVLAPEVIKGITGVLDGDGGKLTFDDKAVQFATLAEGKLSPVCAPWALVHTLRSGYITSCGKETDGIRISIDDSYREDALHFDIWLGEDCLPKAVDINWEGRRILAMTVSNFRFL